jgi:hypothetical protein
MPPFTQQELEILRTKIMSREDIVITASAAWDRCHTGREYREFIQWCLDVYHEHKLAGRIP